METVDATIVFLPRFTTLVGSTTVGEQFEFTTLPLDVSQYAGAQFQVWRGPMSGGTFTLKIEESLDADTWVLGPSTPQGIALNNDETKFISYSFRLRWFRLKVVLTGAASPVVTCWAEGLLRGGGSGVWGTPPASAQPPGRPGATIAGATVGGAVEPPQPNVRRLPRRPDEGLPNIELVGLGQSKPDPGQILAAALPKK